MGPVNATVILEDEHLTVECVVARSAVDFVVLLKIAGFKDQEGASAIGNRLVTIVKKEFNLDSGLLQ